MDYVADTHAIVWYFSDDARLGQDALHAFKKTETEGVVLVSTIVLAEMMYIAQKGRISITFEATLSQLEELDNFRIADLDLDIIRVAADIDDLEMHDRLIVATALYFDATLITKDEQITQSGIVSAVW